MNRPNFKNRETSNLGRRKSTVPNSSPTSKQREMEDRRASSPRQANLHNNLTGHSLEARGVQDRELIPPLVSKADLEVNTVKRGGLPTWIASIAISSHVTEGVPALKDFGKRVTWGVEALRWDREAEGVVGVLVEVAAEAVVVAEDRIPRWRYYSARRTCYDG